MKVILIKWKSRWEDYDQIVGIATDWDAADRHVRELAVKYKDCYGPSHGSWGFEEFTLIGG